MVTFLIGTSSVDIREEICSNKYATAIIVTDGECVKLSFSILGESV